MHNFKVSDELKQKLKKLSKKDKQIHKQIISKIDEIINCDDIDHYKNLMYEMKDSKRVHIGHFVLVFQYDKSKDEIFFDDFDHHDKIYG